MRFTRSLRLACCILVLFLSACSATVSQKLPGDATATKSPPTATATQKPLLPGQRIWKDGASSFLFGTNDTQEWSENNIQTSPSIQKALKEAHFTLLRTFFFDKSEADDHHPITDDEIEQRLKTVENTGMSCLGVLFNVFNVEFMKHVVQLAGSRCLLYEFGNEPDFMKIPIKDYLKQWNTVIPMLRQINPQAKFIGPVTYTHEDTEYIQGFLDGVKESGVMPDAISFHLYPCWEDSREGCLAKATDYYNAALSVRKIVRDTLGKELPIGVTEWNYDPANPPPPYGDEPEFIKAYTKTALYSLFKAGVAFANQFDAASYSGYGRLDMFDVDTNQPKPQYDAMKEMIAEYRIPES
ncbi:hypothetical protein EI42_00116 [Thermosporothrix hazakensis]|jgi:hypothetical protein|uniref:Glycosyl hydrolases family 39 N-terminal catalytic domain-containing protein n=1 Tax=Thermosporothrix hazakensis TaxID=644383 RepID=A0A326UNQ1_THEHA|nr:hypothetical protein [Thermosporothrix hazakensis]PZW35949.1 hypothetical protein EI42_00116 [Thermosporothrix hazakensis]GCE46605.1 hypothetical protein KTH_14740 [Thermosporothrix hazakensis]